MSPEEVVRTKYEGLKGILSENQKRLWAASEACILGYGGISVVQKSKWNRIKHRLFCHITKNWRVTTQCIWRCDRLRETDLPSVGKVSFWF